MVINRGTHNWTMYSQWCRWNWSYSFHQSSEETEKTVRAKDSGLLLGNTCLPDRRLICMWIPRSMREYTRLTQVQTKLGLAPVVDRSQDDGRSHQQKDETGLMFRKILQLYWLTDRGVLYFSEFKRAETDSQCSKT